LTAAGHYTWLPHMQQAIRENPEMPLRTHLMNVNAQWLALSVLLLCVLALLIKAYLVGVVWACYQYIHLRNAARYSVNDLGILMIDDARTDAELLLPPDYETASKMPPVYPGPPYPGPPPPGYNSN